MLTVVEKEDDDEGKGTSVAVLLANSLCGLVYRLSVLD
jgi:hypothetical protein